MTPSDPCVAVVGMHRSGTSATAGLLVSLGLAGPRADDLVPADDSNERGHWESERVHLCNAHILASRGATAYAPPSYDPGWESSPGLDQARSEARRWFDATTEAGRSIVLKDPRLCLTFALWRTVLPVPTVAVFVVRDPLEVAHSLRKRDGIPILLGLALWDRYVRSACSGLTGTPTLVTDYRQMLDDPVRATKTLTEFLAQHAVPVGKVAPDEVAVELDPALRHQAPGHDRYDDIARDLRSVHSALSERVGSHASWTPPALCESPPWVEDVLSLRREFARARRELHWVKASRAYRMAAALWRVKGGDPATAPGARAGTLDQEDE